MSKSVRDIGGKKVVCFYHKECLDGLIAAYIVGCERLIHNVVYVPVHYYDSPDKFLEIIKDADEVYFVDFAFRPDDTVKLLSVAKPDAYVRILDHHATSRTKWLPDNQEVKNFYNTAHLGRIDFEANFDDENESLSGVGMVWRFFNGKKPIPALFAAVQDHDLFKFRLSMTREIVAGLLSEGVFGDFGKIDAEAAEKYRFRYLDTVLTDGDGIHSQKQINLFIIKGGVLLRYRKSLIETIVGSRMKMTPFLDIEVPVVNSPMEFRSDVGEYLNLKIGDKNSFAVTYDDHLSVGMRKYSLRSLKDGGMNVEWIANLFGGGGHEHAASFSLPIEGFPFASPADIFRNVEWRIRPCVVTGNPYRLKPDTNNGFFALDKAKEENKE